jgi:hypothetical protein
MVGADGICNPNPERNHGGKDRDLPAPLCRLPIFEYLAVHEQRHQCMEREIKAHEEPTPSVSRARSKTCDELHQRCFAIQRYVTKCIGITAGSRGMTVMRAIVPRLPVFWADAVRQHAESAEPVL